MKRFIFGSLVLVLLGLAVVGCDGTTTTETEEQLIQNVLNKNDKYMMQHDEAAAREIAKIFTTDEYIWRQSGKPDEVFNGEEIFQHFKEKFSKEIITENKTKIIKYTKSDDATITANVSVYQEWRPNEQGSTTSKETGIRCIEFKKISNIWRIHIIELITS